MKLSKKPAYQLDVHGSKSHNVRIPEQNQLQLAISNQLTANSGNAAEQSVSINQALLVMISRNS